MYLGYIFFFSSPCLPVPPLHSVLIPGLQMTSQVDRQNQIEWGSGGRGEQPRSSAASSVLLRTFTARAGSWLLWNLSAVHCESETHQEAEVLKRFTSVPLSRGLAGLAGWSCLASRRISCFWNSWNGEEHSLLKFIAPWCVRQRKGKVENSPSSE